MGYHSNHPLVFMKHTLKRSRRAIAAGVLSAVAATVIGCSKPPVFHVIVHPPSYYQSKQYKVFLGGRELGGSTDQQQFEFDVTGHTGNSPKEMFPDNLEVRMPYVCGWQRTTFSLVTPNMDDIERAEKQHHGATAHVWVYDLPSTESEVFIYVDNRGGPALTLSVGELQWPVAAGAVDHVFFPYSPACDQAKQLRMNGNLLTTVQEKAGSPGIALPMVLDTTSSHCYREEWATYERSTSFSTLPPGGKGKTIYRPRPLAVLPEKPNLFLQPLPEVVFSANSVASSSALEEVSCHSAAK